MTEYKKWVFGPASDGWIRDEFTGAEEGWRACLEWAIAKLEPDLEDWEQDFLDDIRKELNEN